MSNSGSGQDALVAVDALLRLDGYGRDLCPPDADPALWSSDVLYDLARVADLIGTAVRHLAARPNDQVALHARALTDAISVQARELREGVES